MQVICLEDQAFNAILDRLFDRFQKELAQKEDKWISPEEAMQKLRITSKTTLQKLRDEGKIRYSQPAKKIILYDLDSIYHYLNENARETFKMIYHYLNENARETFKMNVIKR